MNRRWCLLLILIAALFPYSRALFSGGQLGPTEQFLPMVGSPVSQGAANVLGTTSTEQITAGWDVLQADGVLQFWPWRDIVFQSYRNGELPLVNPYQLAGQPLLANSQSGALYPPHILFAFLPGSTALKMLILGVIHAFLGGLGVFTLLRRLSANELGATAGAIGFASSQFMIAWAPLASVGSTCCWIPWMLAAMVGKFETKRIAEMGLAASMLILAGHLQFAAYGVIGCAVFAIVRSASTRSAGSLIALSGLIFGGIISWPQLSQVLQNSQTSHRKNIPSEAGYTAFRGGVILPFELLNVIHPKLLSDPVLTDGQPFEARPTSAYWPLYLKAGANPAEAALYVSPVLILFGMLAFRFKRSELLAPASLVLVGMLLAFGSPLLRAMFFAVPGWSATGSPGRAHILIVLGLCLLGGLGVSTVEKLDTSNRRWSFLALVPVAIFGIGFNLVSMLAPMLQDGESVDALRTAIAQGNRPFLPEILLSVCASAVGIFALLNNKSKPLLRWVGLALVLNPFLFVRSGPALGGITVPGTTVTTGTTVTKLNPSESRIAGHVQEWSIHRRPIAIWPANLATIARRHDLFGYDSLLDAGFVTDLRASTGREIFPPENGNMTQLRGAAATASSEKWALDTVLTGVTTEIQVAKPALPRISSDIPGATIVVDGTSHQIINVKIGTKQVIIRDRYIPGMRCVTPQCTLSNIEGQRGLQCDGTVSNVELRYDGPPVGLLCLAILLLLLLLLLLLIHVFAGHSHDSS